MVHFENLSIILNPVCFLLYYNSISQAFFLKHASFAHEEDKDQSSSKSTKEKKGPCGFEAVLALAIPSVALQPIDPHKVVLDNLVPMDDGEELYFIPSELLDALRPTSFSQVLEPTPWADGLILLPPTPIVRGYQLLSDSDIDVLDFNDDKLHPMKEKEKFKGENFAHHPVYHSAVNQSRQDSTLDQTALDELATTPQPDGSGGGTNRSAPASARPSMSRQATKTGGNGATGATTGAAGGGGLLTSLGSLEEGEVANENVQSVMRRGINLFGAGVLAEKNIEVEIPETLSKYIMRYYISITGQIVYIIFNFVF